MHLLHDVKSLFLSLYKTIFSEYHSLMRLGPFATRCVLTLEPRSSKNSAIPIAILILIHSAYAGLILLNFIYSEKATYDEISKKVFDTLPSNFK